MANDSFAHNILLAIMRLTVINSIFVTLLDIYLRCCFAVCLYQNLATLLL